jgi:hypothetical protein
VPDKHTKAKRHVVELAWPEPSRQPCVQVRWRPLRVDETATCFQSSANDKVGDHA